MIPLNRKDWVSAAEGDGFTWSGMPVILEKAACLVGQRHRQNRPEELTVRGSAGVTGPSVSSVRHVIAVQAVGLFAFLLGVYGPAEFLARHFELGRVISDRLGISRRERPGVASRILQPDVPWKPAISQGVSAYNSRDTSRLMVRFDFAERMPCILLLIMDLLFGNLHYPIQSCWGCNNLNNLCQDKN